MQSIPDNMQARFKYNTKAAQWYRDQLRAQVEGTLAPTAPELEEGKETTLEQTNPTSNTASGSGTQQSHEAFEGPAPDSFARSSNENTGLFSALS